MFSKELKNPLINSVISIVLPVLFLLLVFLISVNLLWLGTPMISFIGVVIGLRGIEFGKKSGNRKVKTLSIIGLILNILLLLFYSMIAYMTGFLNFHAGA